MEHQVTAAVAAPPEVVWRLFVDIERWPDMSESISRLRRVDNGPLRVGSEAIVEQPRLPRARWRVTHMEPGRSFTWATTAPGVTTVGGHTVEADGPGSVVTLTLQVRGPLARPVYALVRERSRRYLAMELEGFRRTAESRPPDNPDNDLSLGSAGLAAAPRGTGTVCRDATDHGPFGESAGRVDRDE